MKFKQSKYGQWAYPGENTLIPNVDGKITMQGVGGPVLGIDDEGNSMIMMPGYDYQFPGNSVYEIPLAKEGGQLPKAQMGAISTINPHWTTWGHNNVIKAGEAVGLFGKDRNRVGPCPKGKIYDHEDDECISYEVYFKKYPRGEEINKAIVEANESYPKDVQWFKDYVNSPRYKQMLKESMESSYPSPSWNPNATNPLADKAFKTMYNARNLNLTTTPPPMYVDNNVETTHPDNRYLAYSMPESGRINHHPYKLSVEPSGHANIHELSHSTDRAPGYSNPRNWEKDLKNLIPDSDVEYINKNAITEFSKTPFWKTLAERESLFPSHVKTPAQKLEWYAKDNRDIIESVNRFNKYVAEPTETRARLMDIRKKSQDRNIYDPFTEKVNSEIYKSLLKENFKSFGQLRQVYSDEDLMWMLNNISKNEAPQVEGDDMQMAKKGGPKVKQRRGVRKNPDGSVSSHLMRAEYIPERGWVAFPSLFQDSKPYADDQQNWVDMSEEEDWMKIYEEAERRGEVYDFGEDKEAALAFGMGSWKDEAIQSPEAWEQEIRRVEREIGHPRGWTMDDYYMMQDKLNEYKAWRERHPEVIDHSNEPNEYVVPLPPHLNADQYMEIELTDEEVEQYKAGGYIEVELSPEDVEKYVKGGYILEELSHGGQPCPDGYARFEEHGPCLPKRGLTEKNPLNIEEIRIEGNPEKEGEEKYSKEVKKLARQMRMSDIHESILDNRENPAMTAEEYQKAFNRVPKYKDLTINQLADYFKNTEAYRKKAKGYIDYKNKQSELWEKYTKPDGTVDTSKISTRDWATLYDQWNLGDTDYQTRRGYDKDEARKNWMKDAKGFANMVNKFAVAAPLAGGLGAVGPEMITLGAKAFSNPYVQAAFTVHGAATAPENIKTSIDEFKKGNYGTSAFYGFIPILDAFGAGALTKKGIKAVRGINDAAKLKTSKALVGTTDDAVKGVTNYNKAQEYKTIEDNMVNLSKDKYISRSDYNTMIEARPNHPVKKLIESGDVKILEHKDPTNAFSPLKLPEEKFKIVDEQTKLKLDRMQTEEGFKLLKEQEKAYINQTLNAEGKLTAKELDDMSEAAAVARIEEVKTLYKNKNYEGLTNVTAHMQSNIEPARLYSNSGQYVGNIKKTFGPVNENAAIAFHPNYVTKQNPAVIQHELGHVTTYGRELPIERELIEAVGNPNLNKSFLSDDPYSQTRGAYDYFVQRTKRADELVEKLRKLDPIKNQSLTKSQLYDKYKNIDDVRLKEGIRNDSLTSGETTSFAQELKQTMMDQGLMKDWFTPITEDMLIQSQKLSKLKPRGYYQKSSYSPNLDEFGDYTTTTRLLDFTDPSRYKQLAKVLNKVAPVVATPVVATSMLDNKRDGGFLDAELGDVVDEATMKRLKKLGYTLKEV